jgi:hypothetical protein
LAATVGIDEQLKLFAVALADALAELLQEKHLYQSVRAPAPLTPVIDGVVQGVWYPDDPHARGRMSPSSEYVVFVPPDVKLFCSRCDRVEAFNLVSASDFINDWRLYGNRRVDAENAAIQVFCLAYLCQSCKGVPEVFLVRRESQRLTLSGRTPIEHVTVPGQIPKAVRGSYRGAVVAHQSGQTLAGNFMLRTLIEQWARENTKRARAKEEGRSEPTESRWRADDVLDVYARELPEDFKGRFGTLRETYSDLSADIHAATGSEDAFNKGVSEIHEHFEARRTFKL